MKQLFTLLFLLSGITVFSQQKTAAKQTAAKSQSVTPATKPTATAKPAAVSTPAPADAKPAATPEFQSATDTPSPRTAATSSQSRAVPLPYNVDDKYMGRKDEFLNDITLPELPADFPVYEKQWSLKEYNQVVDAFFINHKDILKTGVREKIELLQH